MKKYLMMIVLSLLGVATFLRADDSAASQIMSEFTADGGEKVSQKQDPGALENLQALVIKLKNDQIMIDKRYGFWAIATVSSLLILTLLASLIILRGRKAHIDDIIHLIGLITIVYGTILLVLVSKTDQQITAAIGILGAIAGYLFGSKKKFVEPADEKKDV